MAGSLDDEGSGWILRERAKVSSAKSTWINWLSRSTPSIPSSDLERDLDQGYNLSISSSEHFAVSHDLVRDLGRSQIEGKATMIVLMLFKTKHSHCGHRHQPIAMHKHVPYTLVPELTTRVQASGFRSLEQTEPYVHCNIDTCSVHSILGVFLHDSVLLLKCSSDA